MADQNQSQTGSEEANHLKETLYRPPGVLDTQERVAAMQDVPLTLQTFFSGQVNLNRELIQRFPNMPLMSVIRFRDLYGNGERGVATLSTQDGSATLIVDTSSVTHEIQFSFTFGSMLSMRFHLTTLSDLDRKQWLQLMRSEDKRDIIFLWGQTRWRDDYAICVPHPYYMSLLAFTPNNFEAAVRMTPSTIDRLIDWLDAFWYPDVQVSKPVEPPVSKKDEDPPKEPPPSVLSNW